MTESNHDEQYSRLLSSSAKEKHINAAYEALEKMRKMNLELQCSEHNVTYDDECCTACLLSENSNKSNTARFPRLSKWALQLERSSHVDEVNESPIEQQDEPTIICNTTNTNTTTRRFPRISNLIHSEKKRPKAPQCLICGTPTCKQHSSNDFSKEGLAVCRECQHLFGLQFVIDFLTEPQHSKRNEYLDHLLDIYDRVVLLLTFSSQYIPTIAEQLEQSKQRHNHIGLGSSSVGMVSGALGIAAAATILTPVGPPLLVARVDAIHYYSEPQQLAKRIISLQSMLWNILHITGIIRDAMMREHVRSEFYDDSHVANSQFADPRFQQALDQKKRALLSAAGLTSLGRYSAVSAEMSQAGSQGARWMTRTSMNVMRGARLARFAGGAMSATVLVLEAKNVKDTIHAIHSGSPCEQAQQLRIIQDELAQNCIPPTSALDDELHRYLAIVNQRERVWTEEQAAQIILEQNEQACQEEELLEQLKLEQSPEESHVIVDEEISSTATSWSSGSTSGNSLSLLERIALFKQKEKKTGEIEPQVEDGSTEEPLEGNRDATLTGVNGTG